MKTFEGTYTIKWGKNTAPDIRPIVFDCETEEELKKEQQRIIAAYSKEMIRAALFIRNGMIISYHRIQSYSK